MSTHSNIPHQPLGATSSEIKKMGIAALKPRARNPRTHSKEQIKQIAASIERFGFINPVLVDAQGGIIAGHGRVEGAKLAGMAEVPTLRVDHLSEAEIRAYVIADNKLAENAGWDRELLRLELQELSIDLDFDISLTGFRTAEVDILFGAAAEAEEEAAAVELETDIPPVSQVGDLWLIGDHRIICGDARKPEVYEALMDGTVAGAVISDPPYDVPIAGHASGKGKIRHGDFAMASGEMSSPEFVAFLASAFGNFAKFSRKGALHYLFMDWRHMGEMLEAGNASYSQLLNLCVWVKTNGGMGSLYRSQHELVFVFKNGEGPHQNNVQLGKYGRNRTNVWTYGGMNVFGKERDEALASHPTVKPLAMIADAIMDSTGRGDIVLDGFAGSGTTLLAAESTGRRGYGIELDPRYVDLVLRRFRKTHSLEARHAGTGKTFDELAAERREK